VVQLDQMTQQNAALVEESAAAAESLKDQAERLAEAVDRFRVTAEVKPAHGAGFGASKSRPLPSTSQPAAAPRPAASKMVKPAAASPRPATSHASHSPAPAARPSPPARSPAPAPAQAEGDWESF